MEEALELELERAGGGTRRLADLRGRVVVAFWEAREHLSDNAALKADLEALARQPPGVVLLGIADVRAFDVPIVRPIVRQAVAAMARAIGHEILLDWEGALEQRPVSARPGQGNVVVFDREGRPVVRHAGRLSERERARVIEIVRALARPIAA